MNKGLKCVCFCFAKSCSATALCTTLRSDISVSLETHRDDFEHKLLKDLFNQYNKESRPVYNKSKAVDVELDIAYSQLVNLVMLQSKSLTCHFCSSYTDCLQSAGNFTNYKNKN